MRTLWLSVAIGAAFASCATPSATPRTRGENESAEAWQAVDVLGRREPSLAAILAPRESAFARSSEDEDEDEASRGHIVSEGWRATKQKRFDRLGARLSDAASGEMRVGASRFESLHVGVSLVGAREESKATLDRGRVRYPEALPHTDRVLVSDATRLEELLVLRDPAAPRSFTWNIHLAEGLARGVDHAGGVRFEDPSGAPKLVMPAPVAYDANGSQIAITSRWDEGARTFSVTLPSGSLAYPVIVDPIYDVSVWFDLSTRDPLGRTSLAMAYDSVRNEVVMFGGDTPTGVSNETWTWSAATSRWTRRNPSNSPPTRQLTAIAFDSARGETVLFGGLSTSSGVNLADTWVWNGTTWSQRTPATSPPARYYSALAFDSTRGRVVMFGGYGATPLADTWTWDGSDWTNRTSSPSPSARTGHALAFDASRGETVLFSGGMAASDTWVFNGSTWSLRSPATSPPGRNGHMLAYDSLRGKVVLTGGSIFSTQYNDTWLWDGVASTWTLRSPATRPTVGGSAAGAFDSAAGELITFGGQAIGSSERIAETWGWNGTTWTQRGPAAAPEARAYHASILDATRSEVVLFGGGTAFAARNDTWVWSGDTRTWARMTGAAPPARVDHAFAFDTARGEGVMFGGFEGIGGTPFAPDTWVWLSASHTWVRRTPAVLPAVRWKSAMAYDAARAEVILTGGRTGTANFTDTWAWNGASATWTLRTPNVSPSFRSASAMVYDPTRRELVLFGGNGGSAALGDTWAWDGTNWTQRTPATSPPARYGHAMAYDDGRREVVLFGGYNATGPLQDTWAWNGATNTWTRRNSAETPPASEGHSLTPDGHGNLVLFGGFDRAGNLLGKVWQLRTLGGSCASAADCLEGSSCVDGVCCNAASCGTCATCAGTSPGRCAPVSNDEDPDTCAIANAKSCDRVGECKAALGTPATRDAECASGHVVDGVCCATAKCGLCEACNPALKELVGELPGICSAAKSGTDPRDECVTEESSSCQHTGVCDGRRLCAFYGPETSCGPTSVCSGAGTCIAKDAVCNEDRTALLEADGTVLSCGLYRCAGASCKTTCASRADCSGDADCDAEGHCVPFSEKPSTEGGCSASGGMRSANASGALAVFLLLRMRRSRRRTP